MIEKTFTLRPGIMLGLKTSVRGGVTYKRVDLDSDDGSEKWETTKRVQDPTTLKAASKLRARCRQRIEQVCAKTSFALLCANENETKLDAVLDDVRAKVRDWNAANPVTRVNVWCVKARIAESDAQAARGIASDLTDLLDAMNKSISDLDPDAIRASARQARAMLSILSEQKQALANQAIEAARDAASAIAKRVIKKGEDAATVLQSLDTQAISAARVAFLDIEEAEASTTDVAPLPQLVSQRVADVGEEVW